eukprot:403361056
MESSLTDLVVCKPCNQRYNLKKRKPMVSLECLHKACQDCIETKFHKSENGKVCIQCSAITQTDNFKQDVEIQQILQSTSLFPIFCENHPYLSADMLCQNCNVLTCKQCAQTTHGGHTVDKKVLTLDRLNEYLSNAAGLLKQQISSIQAMFTQINDIRENEAEIKNSEFMNLYKQVKTFLSTQITNKHQLAKLDFLDFKVMHQQQLQQNFQNQNIGFISNQNVNQNNQVQLYQQYLDLINLEVQKATNSLLSTAGIENYEEKSFQLLYQGTKDGFNGRSVHQKCDDQGPTAWFILSEFGQVFGAYTSISWEKTRENQNNQDDKAFVFSLSKKSIHRPYQHLDYSIFRQNDDVCQFGYNGDIYLIQNCDKHKINACNLGGTYSLPNGCQYKSIGANGYLAGQQQFRVIDIMIYQFN